jgi:hypothetical protein
MGGGIHEKPVECSPGELRESLRARSSFARRVLQGDQRLV